MVEYLGSIPGTAVAMTLFHCFLIFNSGEWLDSHILTAVCMISNVNYIQIDMLMYILAYV